MVVRCQSGQTWQSTPAQGEGGLLSTLPFTTAWLCRMPFLKLVQELLLLCVSVLALEIDDALLAKAASRFLVVATEPERWAKHPSGKHMVYHAKDALFAEPLGFVVCEARVLNVHDGQACILDIS